MKTLKRNAVRLVVILWVISVLVAIVLVALIPKARAGAHMMTCYPYEEYSAGLYNSYGEGKIAHGQVSTGRAVELFVNPDTRSWTLVVKPPNQSLACPVLAGEGWENLEPEPPKPETQTH